MLINRKLFCAAVLGVMFVSRCVFAQPLELTGVNLSGAEFGDVKRGKLSIFNRNYTYPTVTDFKYFAGKGCNVVRVPFLWERLQPDLAKPVDAEEAGRIKKVVTEAGQQGLSVILDVHNYARYYGELIGSSNVSDKAFCDLWAYLAGEYKPNTNVIFGLMNEPNNMPTRQWVRSANSAIAAIRGTGAKNLILVPGNHFTGAHSWVGEGPDANSVAMLEIKDPGNDFILEAHQYLDRDHSGTKPEVMSATIGSERLVKFTGWCREHHYRAFLGEFGAAGSQVAGVAIDDMLTYMEKNRDVWVGFTWWSAGPWWGDYMFSVQPKDGKDAAQMQFLAPHLQGATKR